MNNRGRNFAAAIVVSVLQMLDICMAAKTPCRSEYSELYLANSAGSVITEWRIILKES